MVFVPLALNWALNHPVVLSSCAATADPFGPVLFLLPVLRPLARTVQPHVPAGSALVVARDGDLFPLPRFFLEVRQTGVGVVPPYLREFPAP